MFNNKKILFKISLINLLFLNYARCFPFNWPGEWDTDTDGDGHVADTKLMSELSSKFEYPQDSSYRYFDCKPCHEGFVNINPPERREKEIAEILARGIQTKEDRYKVERKIDTTTYRLFDGSPSSIFPHYRKSLRNSLGVKTARIEIGNHINPWEPKYGTTYVYTDQDMYHVAYKAITKTSNCPGGLYLYQDTIDSLEEGGKDMYYIGLPGIFYRPKKGEAGNIFYSYKDAYDISDFPNPILRLEFEEIFKPFTIEASLGDQDNYITYPKVQCAPGKLTYEIKLLSENNPVDFAKIKDISFIFEPIESSNKEEDYFCLPYIVIDSDELPIQDVPEPLSLVTMGLGLTALIKKRK